MRSVVAAMVALSVLAGASAMARAATDGQPLLRRGIQLYREASYAEAVAMLEHARARGGLEPPERVECAFYLAAGYVALNSMGAARRELRTVLQDAPDYELPQYTSPKVAALFRQVREELENAPRLRPLPPERRGDLIVLRFEASRTGGRAFGSVQWRWRGDERWREAALRHDGDTLVADVRVERTGALDYFAEGRAPNGPLSAGSAQQPLELPVGVAPSLALVGDAPAPAMTPSSKRNRKLAWLWVSLAAVSAAGAGVGLYFALRPPSSPTADAVFDFQVH